MIFGDFSVNSKLIFFQNLQRLLSIQILTALKQGSRLTLARGQQKSLRASKSPETLAMGVNRKIPLRLIQCTQGLERQS